MASTFKVTIVERDGPLYDGEAQYLRAPGREGSFGVMARHAPMVAELAIGPMKLVTGDGEVQWLACAGGVLEVRPDGHVVVLTEAAEFAEEIDLERAQAAAERARRRLHGEVDAGQVDVERARIALMKALNRLRVAEKVQGKPQLHARHE